MAKKTTAKKAVKPVKKAPAKKAPAKSSKASKPVKKAPVKKAPAKKAVVKKPVAKKPLAKKAPVKKTTPAKKTAIKKSPATGSTVKKAPVKKAAKSKAPAQGNGALRQQFITKPVFKKNLKLSPFLGKQRQRLLQLKDTLLDSMSGVARGNLHAGSETSAFGMHQADAGSDAYDRDFALSILSQEQNSLYEIDEALKRIEDGTYGHCEICNKPIPQARLEARPFTRTTVDCQEQLEKRQHHQNARLPINSLFGLTEEEAENEEEDTTENN